MSKKAFDLIDEGLAEALAVAQGEVEPFRIHVPSEIDLKTGHLHSEKTAPAKDEKHH